MLFTMGNLITLGVVVVILLVYRQLDRDNRSLEKVKKLGDRLQGELDSYVGRRAEEVKQYAIELDVHQQAAKEVLKRLQSVEDGLNARAEGFAVVEKRLGEYDSVLSRLMEMTARVDVNLARIQDESEFTDKVAKRVEEASKSLVALEREIPGLRDDFAREGRSTLEAYKEEMLADAGRRLSEIQAILNEAKFRSDEAAEAAALAKREAEREFVKAFERSRVEAEKLEGIAFEKLRNLGEAKAARLRETVEEKFAQIGQLAKDKAVETQALARSFKAEWKAEAEALVGETKAGVAAAAERVEARMAETEAKVASVEAAIGESYAKSKKAAEVHGTEVEARIAEAARRVDEALAAMSSRLAEALGRADAADAEMDRHLTATISRASEADAVLAASVAAAVAKAEALSARLFEEARAGMGKGLEALRAELAAGEERRAAFVAEAEGRFAAVESRSAAVEAEVERRLATVSKKAEELAAGYGEKVKALLAGQREDFEKKVAEAKAAQSASIAELRSGIEAAREAKAAQEKELKAMLAGARADAAELAERLSKGGENSALEVLAAVERRLDEYGSEVEAKFQRLEAVNVDIGILEAALRSAMSDMGRKIEGDFIAFGRSLEERRRGFEEAFSKDATALSASMRTLEGELDSLKARAYENVSKQLKVFEDEFFADLGKRREASEAALQAWKADRDKALAEMGVRASSERAAAEKSLVEESRKALAETQARVFDQLEAVRSRADSIQTGIAAEAKAAQDAIVALREGLRRDLLEARKAAEDSVTEGLGAMAKEAEARTAAAEVALQKRLAALGASLSSEELRLRESREETTKALEAFRSGFRNSIADAEARLRSDLEVWKRDSAALAQTLRADYEGQRDLWIAKSKEERERIQKEVTGLSERSASLREALEERMTEALAGFSKGYEELAADQGRRSRELQAETEEKALAFRNAAQELAARVDSTRTQAFAKIDAEAQRIGQALGELERQQKAFTAETRIFERSDELSARLGAAIEAMKADLAGIETRRGEMAELEAQLGKVKKLEDEVNQKLTRFLAEKKRVDSLEEGFARLSSVAQGVDRKLGDITGQSDSLTEAEARIRRILELSAEAETKYERLEKKGQVMDATVEAVDKNFRTIGEIEKTVSALGGELRRLPERISEIERSLTALSLGKERADEAARKLAELDSIMAEAEKRIGEAQKVREWLARAETRLEEINRQAEEQLKLLSTLLKEEGADKRGKGAPPGSVQETVRKLARQGWNTDEIARAVKVSRGEVELILELGGKG